ncbi:MAG: hypothetical protein M1530_00775 [Candidatus Marsarchaeota archaeon]|nr:hypothetical protein [Candidatus Marsarchaeota archaeon]
MAETRLSLAYRALLASMPTTQVKIVDSDAIAKVAKALGFKPAVIRQGLVRGHYLLPVHFDGVYYLLDPDELGTKFLRNRSYEIMAAACTHALGKRWYFGINSALYLNGKINQSPREFIIITDKHQQTTFSFEGNAFRIRRSSVKDYSLEIEEKMGVRFSSPARTLTDYLYFNIKGGKTSYAIRMAKDILHSTPDISKKLIRDLIGLYPAPYNKAIGNAAEAARG